VRPESVEHEQSYDRRIGRHMTPAGITRCTADASPITSLSPDLVLADGTRLTTTRLGIRSTDCDDAAVRHAEAITTELKALARQYRQQFRLELGLIPPAKYPVSTWPTAARERFDLAVVGG
jgi:hypothetical protein